MTRIVRSTPPSRWTAATPSTPSRRLATVLSMYQLSCSSVMSVVCGADVGDRLVLGVDPRDLRLEDAVGQVAADLGDRVADVIDRAVGRGAELELDEGGAVAFADRAVDLLDAVHAADRRLDPLRDLRLHFVRSGAGLGDWTIAAGKSMSGSLFTCIRANAMIPASIRPTNSTIGPTGFRMHQEEMLRKFMSVTRFPGVQRAACRLGFTFWPGLRNGPADSTTASLPQMPSAMVTPLSLTVPILTLRRSTSFLALTT